MSRRRMRPGREMAAGEPNKAEAFAAHIRSIDTAAEALKTDPDPCFAALGKALLGYRVTANRATLGDRLIEIGQQMKARG